MSDELRADLACAVCGRRLLPGERPTEYVTREGASVTVCELCRPRAEADGWLLPEEAALRGGAGRERRRPRGQMFSGLRARRPAPAGAGEEGNADEEAPLHPQRPRRPERPRAPEPAAPAEAPVAGDSPGVTVSESLRAFNASNHRRTVAGLTRTLGPPRATALAVRAANGYPGVRLTIAWELTWYQWEVSAGPRGPEVRESGKGETIDQLRAADRTWNLLAGGDGTLEQRSAGAAAAQDGGERR